MNAGLLAASLGDGTDIVQIVLIVCVFLVLIWGRDSIRNPVLFRVGCLMLAGSLVLPTVGYILDGHYLIELPQFYGSLPYLLTGPLLVVFSFPCLAMSLGQYGPSAQPDALPVQGRRKRFTSTQGAPFNGQSQERHEYIWRPHRLSPGYLDKQPQ